MESTLTPSDPTEDPLEALLRTAPPSIPDDGFTARVCTVLPAREVPVPRRIRWLVLAGAVLFGCALAWEILSHVEPAWPQAVFAAAFGWMLEPWYAWSVLLTVTIWGTFAVSRNESVDDALGRSL